MQEDSSGRDSAALLEALMRAFDAACKNLPAPLAPDVREQLLEKLLAASPEQRTLIATNRATAQRPEILELLAERAHAWRQIDPAKGLTIAEAATQLADRLEPNPPLSRLLEDARAEAWAVQANLERALERYDAAESSWRRAREHRCDGTADPLLEARHAYFEAALHRDRRRFRVSETLLKRARRLYLELGEHNLASEVSMGLAMTQHQGGDDSSALRAAVEAGNQLDVAADPSLAASLLFNSLLYALELGHKRLVYLLFEHSQWLFDQHLPASQRLKALWRRGELARELKDLPTAIRCLDEVRQRLSERERAYDASRAALELATIYLEANLPQRARELAEEMLPVFVSKQIPREASAALLVYVHAARQEGLSAALLEHVQFDFKRLCQRDASASSWPK